LGGITTKERSSMKESVNIQTVNKATAENWLSKMMKDQRNIRSGKVLEYAKEMIAGKWYLSNDAIVFVGDVCVNGQHRLSAVSECGIECQFLVLNTDNDKLIRVIDGGTPRKIADVLAMDGIIQSKRIAAVASWVMAYNRNALTSLNNATQTSASATSLGCKNLVTRQERVQWCVRNASKVCEAISVIEPLYKKYGVLSESLAESVFVLIAEKYSAEKASQFLTELYTGDTSSASVKNLRNVLIKDATLVKRKMPTATKFGYLILGFNSWSIGSTRDVYRIACNEKFPRIA
jgi:hypothetical protein